MKMKLKPGMIVVFFALLTGFAYGRTLPEEEAGADAGSESATAEKADYSKGFAKYYEMGLPSVVDGKYVKLDIMYGAFPHSGHFYHGFQRKGNAWLIEENEEGPSKFVTESSKVIEVYEHNALQKIVQAERKEEEGGEEHPRVHMRMGLDPKGRIGGRWKEVDLEKDIEATLEHLRKAQENTNSNRMFSYSNNAGGMLLDSIHYHSQGYEDEANEIVQLLFDLAGDQRKILVQAVNLLADNEYAQVMDRFLVHGDFEQMEQELIGLLKRFRVGWKNGLAVKKVLEDVQRRVRNPEPPEIDGLSPSEAAAAKRMAEVENSAQNRMGNHFRYSGANSLWVLDRPGKELWDKDEEKRGIFAEIKHGGVESVPLLVALLDDDYLTKLPSDSMGGVSRMTHSGDGEMDEEQIESVYQSMRRPLTRGDIAYRFLVKLPLSKHDYRFGSVGQSREELAAVCEQWYADNKDKTQAELARFYLESPGNQQRNAAFSFLLAHGEEEDMKALEEVLLQADSMNMNMHMLQRYVTARGAEAKDFIERYEERMQSSDGEMYMNENEEQTRKMIEQLKKIASQPSPEELLAEIVAGNKSIEAERVALRQGLSRKSVAETLGMLLDAAAKTQSAQVRSKLLGLVAEASTMRRHYANPHFGGMRNADEPELSIADKAEIWNELLGDDRALPSGYMQSKTVRESAAMAIESLYGRDNARRISSARAVLGSRLSGTLLQRARERLAGKSEHELDELPSADNVDADRVEEIMAALASVDVNELAEFSKSLDNDELLALGKEEFDAKLNTRLTPTALVVREVEFHDAANAAVRKLEDFKGRQLDREMLEGILELCGEVASPGKQVAFRVLRKPRLGGVFITFREFGSDSPELEQAIINHEKTFEKGVTDIVAGRLRGGGLYASCEWRQREAREHDKAEESESGNMLDDMLAAEMDELKNETERREGRQKEKFWEAVDKFVDGDCAVWNVGHIYFAGMTAPVEEEKQ